jgi:uncharacterized phage protein (TIGR01671 family)
VKEIRFRAWDKKRKIMVGNDYPNNWEGIKDEFWGDWVAIEISGIEHLNEDERFEVMQYTGLKDHNNCEIYEGDIIPHHERWGIEELDTNMKVCFGDHSDPWFDANAYGWYLEGKHEDFALTKEVAEKVEVIGNIYQSPGLLE